MQGSKPTIQRRDDRAEPEDDDAASSSRIDVVSVDSPRGGDTATSGMVALRRELAKLNQQAAAVEKSLDEQRRDRSDSLERIEKAHQHALGLEARIATAEAETAALRKAHELAIAEMQASHDASLGELRKAREELARAKEEHARDRTTARERIAVLERGAEESSALAQRTQSELDTARENEVRLSGDVQGVRENSELLATQLEAARQSEERLGRQLEAALARAAEAESQALTISLQHASLEGSLRTLREEIAEAFARVGTQAAAAAAVSSSRMLPLTPDLTDSSVDMLAAVETAAPELSASVPPSGVKTAPPPALDSVPADAKRSTPPPSS